MKWVFVLGVIFLAPALAALLRSNSRYLTPICFVLGATILLLGPNLWTAPISWPDWPSPTEGVEISFVDSFSLALLLATRRVPIPLLVKTSFAVICLALAISTAVSYNKMASFFYLWQFLRATLFFLAIARVYATEPRAAMALLAGLWTAMIAEPVWVLLQHAHGVERPGGSFGHSNTFGIAADFVVFPGVAIMLGGRRWLLPALAVVGAFIAIVLGESRASMGLFAAGVFLTAILSMLHKSSSRKFAFVAGLVLLLAISAPVMVTAVANRSAESLESSDQERAAMKLAGSMIIADHPLGIGPNQYSVVANTGGYAARAGVPWNPANRRAPVHDTYYLVTAETGFLGLIGLLSLLGSFIVVGFACLRRRIPSEAGELTAGLLATMMVVAIHISFEFTFMSFMLHYLFAASGGLLVGIWATSRAVGEAPVPKLASNTALSHAT